MEKEIKKRKLIIDTDPGVDDATALMIALNSEKFDIKLITTTAGNVGIKKTTRNALFLVDYFNKNIPVAVGAKKPLYRKAKNAIVVHGKEGLGGYIPKHIKTKAIKEKAVDQMYKIIKENPHEITLLVLGPHTNIANLFIKYPESKNLIKDIVFEGGSPYGKAGVKPHISFNISYDPEAADIVMKTNIPKTIIPSELGRYVVYFTNKEKEKIANLNESGKILKIMLDGYINRYGLNITQANDLCAVMYMLYPNLFETYRCEIFVDTQELPGKMIIKENNNGIITFVENANKEKFIENFIKNFKKLK